MGNTTLNWQLRKILSEFRESGRLAVWIAYLLHANERGRAWPSVKLLEQETGYSHATVIEAKKWLIEHGALSLVPLELRVEKEAAKHHLAHVMQVHESIEIDGKGYRLLYNNKFVNDDIPESLGKESLPKEGLDKDSEPEGITNTKGIDNSKGVATTPPPVIKAEHAKLWQQAENALVTVISRTQAIECVTMQVEHGGKPEYVHAALAEHSLAPGLLIWALRDEPGEAENIYTRHQKAAAQDGRGAGATEYVTVKGGA